MPRKADPRYLAANGFKLCKDCKCVKSVSEFYKSKDSPDGYTRICGECVRARSRAWYQDNREYKAEKDKAQRAARRRVRTYSEKYPVIDGMKRCTACDEVLPAAMFSPKGKTRPGLRPECKACSIKRSRETYQKSRERYLASSRKQRSMLDDETRARYGESHRRRRKRDPEWRRQQDERRRLRRYGLTVEGYEALLAAQGGVCAICGGPPSTLNKQFHVDHDHVTGAFRGILCGHCNVALGCLKDDPVRVAAALAYLLGHSSAQEQRRAAVAVP